MVLGSLVAGLFYLYMGHLLGISLGLFHPKIGLYTLFYFSIIPLLMASSFRQNAVRVRKGVLVLLSLGQLLFVSNLVKNPHVIYQWQSAVPLPEQVVFHWLLIGAQILSAALFLILFYSLFMTGQKTPGLSGESRMPMSSKIQDLLSASSASSEGLYGGLAFALMGILIAAEFLVPTLSPRPVIDVFVNNTAAVDFFLKSKNPYSQSYVDIYKGLFSYRPGFLYFPGLLFCLAPFKALFGDIRYCFVFVQILNAWLIHRIVRRREGSKEGGSYFSWLLPVVWLSFPVTYHVLEQSWTDTILIGFTFLIADSIDLRRWTWVGILSGLIFSTKQYGFVISFFALLRVAQCVGWRQALRCGVLAAVAFLAVLFPFAVANFKGLYAMTIQAQTGPGIRTDSLGMASYLVHQWHYYLPGSARIWIALLGVGGGIGIARISHQSDRFALALFTSYGCAFLFGKWAFCNYHYLLASFLILYLASQAQFKDLQREFNNKSRTLT